MVLSKELSVVGAEVREASAADEIQGVRAARVITPDTPEAVQSVLATLSARSASVVIRGAGTKLDWGRVPGPIDAILDLSRLNRLLVHEHGDMTATIEAGARLTAVNDALARHGQWLPVDGGFEAATLGGLLASADSGPLRHRFGSLRDLIIGVRLATTSGELVEAGGRVVKNVAGYDLGKLMSGSHGSFAAIVSATFKLAPRLLPSSTLVAAFEDGAAFGAAISRMSASQLEPTAFDLHVVVPARGTRSTHTVLLRFASTARGVDAAVASARELLGGASVEEQRADVEEALWRRQARAIWQSPGLLMRTSWRSADGHAVVKVLEHMRDEAGVEVEWCGRAALGVGIVRLAGSPEAQLAAVAALRGASDVVSASTVLRAERSIKTQVDSWGDLGSSLQMAQAVKRTFDPRGILNAGRGPV